MENNILFFFNSRPLLEIFLKFWQISQNIQRGDPWDFFIIGIFFEILKIFPKYPKGGPLGFFYYWNIFWNFEKISKISKGGTLGIFFLGVPPPLKKFFLMHFWMNWGYKKKKCGTGLTLLEISILFFFFFEPFPNCLISCYIWLKSSSDIDFLMA